MSETDPYKILGLSPSASQSDIKQAYRRLAKAFHPDSQTEDLGSEKIISLNAAYEVLGDVDRRRHYDRHRQWDNSHRSGGCDRHPRSSTAYDQAYQSAQARSTQAQAAQAQKRRTRGQAIEVDLADWTRQIYNPVSRLLNQILRPLNQQLNDLAADPFDDDLMAVFMAYLEDCRRLQEKANGLFQSMPNPPSAAGPASKLYYAINHLSDGLDELELFTSCYDESYLHSGKELFRRARQFRQEAQESLKRIGR